MRRVLLQGENTPVYGARPHVVVRLPPATKRVDNRGHRLGGTCRTDSSGDLPERLTTSKRGIETKLCQFDGNLAPTHDLWLGYSLRRQKLALILILDS